MSGTVRLPSRTGRAIKVREPLSLSETLTVRLTADDVDRLVSASRGQPVSLVVRRIVREWLALRGLS
jgi:hypothetical protein